MQKPTRVAPSVVLSKELVDAIDEASALLKFPRGRSYIVREAIELWLRVNRSELQARRLALEEKAS